MKKLLLSISSILVLQSGIFSQTGDGGITNNGAVINIQSGTFVVVTGGSKSDYINSGNGAIALDGTLILEGDWINTNADSNAFKNSAAGGKVILNGNTNNSVITNSVLATFDNIQINRAGTNTIVNGNFGTRDSLQLTAGILTTSTDSIEVEGKVHGGSSTSFINGNIVQTTGANNTYRLPVGDGLTATNYHLCELTTANTFSGVSRVAVHVKELGLSGDNVDANLAVTSVSQNGTQIDEVTKNNSGDYVEWEITPVTGSLSSGSYDVDLSTNDLDIIDDQFTVIKRPSNSTDFGDFDTFESTTSIPANGQPGRTVASGFARKTGFTSFSRFSLGTGITPLPIELVNFSSFCNDGEEVIEWATASEINHDFFVVEGTNDGSLFTEVYYYDNPNANSSDLNEYRSEELYEEMKYYRLKSVDLDGTTEFSDIISSKECATKVQENEFTISTNGQDNIIINANMFKSDAFQISLIDPIGRFVRDFGYYNLNLGNNRLEYGLGNLATGIYIVNMSSESENISKSIYVK